MERVSIVQTKPDVYTEKRETVFFPACKIAFTALFFLILHTLTCNVNNAAAKDLGGLDPSILPMKYGQVIFRCNEDKPAQVYIIGMSHRDTLTRVNGLDTVDSQVEVYRIGEWLIRNQGLQLILPEGFFGGQGTDDGKVNRPLLKKVSLDKKTLEERLYNDSVYVNAEILLMESNRIKSRQVEDRALYDAVKRKIKLLADNRENVFKALYIKSTLDYLQERRTAAMLQNIPDIIEHEFSHGKIEERKAIFTIGLQHIPLIIKYLSENRIKIPSPAFSSFEDYHEDTKLLENYAVTVIVPRTLMARNDMLRLARLYGED